MTFVVAKSGKTPRKYYFILTPPSVAEAKVVQLVPLYRVGEEVVKKAKGDFDVLVMISDADRHRFLGERRCRKILKMHQSVVGRDNNDGEEIGSYKRKIIET